MKVALCLSGQSRTFEKCYPSQLAHIINKYNCDVFIHTWCYNGYNKSPENLHYRPEYNIDNYDKYLNDNYIISNKIFFLYKPKKCIVEYPDKSFFIKKLQSNIKHGFFNTIMMQYGVYMSNKLKSEYELERKIKYDIVIRCRFDLSFTNVELIFNNVNTIHIPPNENTNVSFDPNMKRLLETQGPSYMTNDQFAYGSSDAMNYYSSLYDLYTKNINCYIDHPEGMLSQHLWKFNKSQYKPFTNDKILMEITA